MSKPDPTPTTDKPSFFDRMNVLAASKVKTPGWVGWKWECAPQGGLFVTGAVCPLVTRGPRKGKPVYRLADRATQATIYLSKEECADVKRT